MKPMHFLAIAAAVLVLAFMFACAQNDEDHITDQNDDLGGGGDSGGGGDDDAADDDTADDDDDATQNVSVALICNDATRDENWNAALTPLYVNLTPISEDEILTADFTGVQVILVDMLTDWVSVDAVQRMVELDLPIVGVYDGGGVLFSYLGLNIGWSGGFTDNYAQDYRVVNASHAVFNSPFDLGVADGDVIQIFPLEQNIHYYDLLNDPFEDVVLLAERDVDEGYSGLTLELGQYIYWGLQTSPEHLTDAGLMLMSNCLHYLAE